MTTTTTNPLDTTPTAEAVADALAALLPEWERRPSGVDYHPQDHARMTHRTEPGAELTLTTNVYGKRGRLVISASFPHGTSWTGKDARGAWTRDYGYTITVDATRPASAIVKAITGRLLGDNDYFARLREALAAKQDTTDRFQRALNTAEVVAVAMRANFDRSRYHEGAAVLFYGSSAEADVNTHTGRVTLKLRDLTEDQARCVLNYLHHERSVETGQ